MPPELTLGFIGTVVGALLAYLSARFTARQSRKAAETTAAVSNRQVDVEEWRAIVGELRAEIERLSGRVDSLESRRDEDRALIARLEADLRARDRNYRRLLRYVREVLSWARRVAPDHDPPPVPDHLAEDLA